MAVRILIVAHVPFCLLVDFYMGKSFFRTPIIFLQPNVEKVAPNAVNKDYNLS